MTLALPVKFFHMLEIAQGDILLTLLTIVVVEIVLGVDNLVVLFSVLKKKARKFRLRVIIFGFLLSILLRGAILGTALTVLGTTLHLFEVDLQWFSIDIGSRGLIFAVAGIFLITHAFLEIKRYLDKDDIETEDQVVLIDMALPYMVVWVAVIDLVFSYDSLLGVIAVSQNFALLMTGMIISRILIVLFLQKIYRFIHSHPELIIVMFIFLGFIGVSLLMEGLFDMETKLFGWHFKGFPATWLYSIFVVGIVYSIFHSQLKRIKPLK